MKYPNSLREQANHLALAQCVSLRDNYSRKDAWEELNDNRLWNMDEVKSFIVVGHLEGLSLDQLFGYVDSEADAIHKELKVAYDLGAAS